MADGGDLVSEAVLREQIAKEIVAFATAASNRSNAVSRLWSTNGMFAAARLVRGEKPW